jgi:hypothetical protein
MLEELRARVCWVLCFIIVLCSSCDGRVRGLASNSDDKRTNESDTLSYLDVNKPTLVQPIVAADRIQEGRKFVQVEVVEVKNPKGYAATFRVDYQTKGGGRIFLGTFSLYPSDNPGKFIVPTQGKLRNEGAILLSLIIPDDFKSGDVLRVGVRKIKFLKE